MNEGIFEDDRYRDIIETTADEIRLLIEETAKPRPPKKTVHFVRVEMQTGEGRFTVVNWAFRCDSTEEAKRRLKHHTTEEDGHIYDLYEKWTDSDGNEHRCEYFITEGEYEDWEEGYEGVCNYEPDYSKKTIAKFHKAIKVLSEGDIYAQRIDRLVRGLDSEDTFHEQLKSDLEKLKYKDNE